MSTTSDVAVVAAAAVVIAAAVAGCGSDERGIASANEVGMTAASKQAEAGLLPPRTGQAPVDGRDPCALLTEQQLDELKVNSKPRAVTEPRDGPTCSFDVDLAEPYYSYAIELITTADVEDWITGDRLKSSMTREPTNVDGFPALHHYRAGETPADCETLVGVAPGQTMRVQTYPLTQKVFDQRQLCDMSGQVATLAVRNLQAK